MGKETILAKARRIAKFPRFSIAVDKAIGTLLRHSSPEATAIYARVDVRMLRELVQPWPFEGDVR